MVNRGGRVQWLAYGLLLAVLGLAAACGGPSPTRSMVTVNASPLINPNSDDQPSPTVVRFYDLTAADKFNNASFFAIYDDEGKTLGADLLARREIEIQPGKTMVVDRVAPSGTLVMGVLAGFRDINGATWRDVFPISPGSNNKIILTLQTRSIALSKPRSRFLGIF